MATEKQIKAKEAKEEREAKEKKRLEKIKKMRITGKVKPVDMPNVGRIASKVKGIPSDFDVKMFKDMLPTKKDGGMIKGYKSGGVAPAMVLGGIGKKIEDSIKTIDLDTAPKKVLGGLAGRLATRGYGAAKK